MLTNFYKFLSFNFFFLHFINRKTPSKEMKAALKVINDSLQKSSKSNNLKNANGIVQKEWFQISSTDKANPMDVEDYLDCFEEYSNLLLKYVVNMTDSNVSENFHYHLCNKILIFLIFNFYYLLLLG